MDEQKNVGTPGQPEGDEWRPPPPYIGLPVLIMVFMTASTLFYVSALLVIQDNRRLRYILAALLLVPVVYGWWLLARSRRRGPVTVTALFPATLAIIIMPILFRVLLGLAEGRPVSVFDVVALAIYGVIVLLYLFRNRLPPPFGERGRR